MAKLLDPFNEADLDFLIERAAKAADYEHGFGLRGCDLKESRWWAAYARQSSEEQRLNNRLPEYLHTCAREAKMLGVVVPREYVLFDAVSGEHLERPQMVRLREELVPERRISGVIFPLLERLSREPIHVGILEFQLDHAGIRYHYADAPNGSDPMSQMVRQNLAHAAKYVKMTNRRNNRAGNIGRALKGIVPAFKPAYGYRYHAEYSEVGFRRIVTRAWWEADAMDGDGNPTTSTPAWVVLQAFQWVGDEGRTLHWAVRRLNDLGIPSAAGSTWTPGKLHRLIRQPCYTGTHNYNVHLKVADPTKPLIDITAEIKRTRLQKKPESEWVRFSVPALVSDELWQRANQAITERGRGRGKAGRSIKALLRSRLFCPRCGRPMVVRRHPRYDRLYYHCSAYFKPWMKERCSFRKFVPGAWDDAIWEDVSTVLRNDTWIESQIIREQGRGENVRNLIHLQESKIAQAAAKISKVRDGFEGGIYSLEQAKDRIGELETRIAEAQEELRRLKKMGGDPAAGAPDVAALRIRATIYLTQ